MTAYYRDFQHSGILSHYAYVRKSNYLLPVQLVPLLRDAIHGRSFIDPEIEQRVLEVRHKDEQAPLACLEPNEQVVAQMIAQGFTNEQIADRLGFRDKRTISPPPTARSMPPGAWMHPRPMRRSPAPARH